MTEYNSHGLKCPLVYGNDDFPKIGQLIEVFDNNPLYKIWSVAQIIDIKNNKIKIHWCGWREHYDEWINKTNKKRLAPLHTHTFPMEPLAKPPRICVENWQPSIYNSCILMKENKYDIKQKTWSKPQAEYIACFVDHVNNRMICVDFTGIYTLDFYTNETAILLDDILEMPQQPEDIYAFRLIGNELHIISYEHIYCVYDINTKKMIKLPTATYSHGKDEHRNSSKMIYIKSKNIFISFIFNYHTDSECDFEAYYCENNNSNYWIKYNEISSNNIIFNYDSFVDVINIFDHLLIFQFEKSKIMFFDLLTLQWYDCDKLLPVSRTDQWMVHTMDNYLHIIRNDFSLSNRVHYKINIMDMIPLTLDTFYRNNKYNKLTFGYLSNNKRLG
eukprot:477750_1